MVRFPEPLRASEIATRVVGVLNGPDPLLVGVAALSEAGANELAYHDRGPVPDCGAVLSRVAIAGRSAIVVADPLAAMALLLAGAFVEPAPEPGSAAIHPSARIHPSAVVHPGVVVAAGVVVGAETVLYPNVVLYRGTSVGSRVRIHAGAVIGADGFRFHATPSGLVKIPHVGGVFIDDDVEIGANTCIDRGMLADTRIGRGAKIDNAVQIGHNCVVEPGAILVAQVGLAGSVTIGAGAILAGQVGVKDHVTIGAGARIGARSAVHGDVPAGETWLGEPARPAREAMRIYAALRYLPELVRALRR